MLSGVTTAHNVTTSTTITTTTGVCTEYGVVVVNVVVLVLISYGDDSRRTSFALLSIPAASCSTIVLTCLNTRTSWYFHTKTY